MIVSDSGIVFGLCSVKLSALFWQECSESVCDERPPRIGGGGIYILMLVSSDGCLHAEFVHGDVLVVPYPIRIRSVFAPYLSYLFCIRRICLSRGVIGKHSCFDILQPGYAQTIPRSHACSW
jgi:hypothetical protein